MSKQASKGKKRTNWMKDIEALDTTSFLWGIPTDVWHDIVIDPSSLEWNDKDDTHKFDWMTVELSIDGGEEFEVEEVPFWMRKQMLKFLQDNFDGNEEYCAFAVMREKDGDKNEASFRL